MSSGEGGIETARATSSGGRVVRPWEGAAAAETDAARSCSRRRTFWLWTAEGALATVVLVGVAAATAATAATAGVVAATAAMAGVVTAARAAARGQRGHAHAPASPPARTRPRRWFCGQGGARGSFPALAGMARACNQSAAPQTPGNGSQTPL